MTSRPLFRFALRASVVLVSLSLGALAAPSCSSEDTVHPIGLSYGVSSSSSSSSSSTGSTSSSGEGSGGAGGSSNASSSNASSSNASSGGGDGGAGGDPLDGGASDAMNACGTIVSGFPVAASPHVAACSPVVYDTNPPTSGPHYPNWAAFKAYSSPVPRGFWVHDLEHGAVVITYNCPAGCDAEVQGLLAYLDSLPPDPLCTPPLKARYVITPDPELDVLFAASAWGFHLKSSCFDLNALGAFITDHYAKGPENFCFDGIDVLAPDAGAGCP